MPARDGAQRSAYTKLVAPRLRPRTCGKARHAAKREGERGESSSPDEHGAANTTQKNIKNKNHLVAKLELKKIEISRFEPN